MNLKTIVVVIMANINPMNATYKELGIANAGVKIKEDYLQNV